MMRRLCLTLALLGAFLLLAVNDSQGGAVYKITSSDGTRTISYEVKFGGGFTFQQYTAYCPEKKKFVYLTWSKAPAPQPVQTVSNPETGKPVPLYRFPNCETPLPVIRSVDDLKICPITGNPNPKKVLYKLYD